MRILHLLGKVNLPRNPQDGAASGVVRAALETARMQARDGHDVTVAASGSVGWSSRWGEVTLRSLPEWPWAKLRINGRVLDLRQHAAFVGLTLARRYDVVHAHNYGYLRLLRATHKVMHFHADPTAEQFSDAVWHPGDFALVQNTASQIIAVSQFVKKQLTAAMGPNTAVSVVPNGVNLEAFFSERLAGERERVRARLGIPPNAVMFLYCGAIHPVKGVVYLAHAFEGLAKISRRAHLVLAGSSGLWGGNSAGNTYEREVRQVLSAEEIRRRVRFMGLLGHDALPALYQAADVVVVPSLTEAFGMSALEAMASGKPIIASNTGGLPELVGPKHGILVEPGNVPELAAAMAALDHDEELRRQYGINARLVAEGMSWDASADLLKSTYAAMLRPRFRACPHHPCQSWEVEGG